MLFSPSLEAKKQFVAWMIKEYPLPRRESLWVLNYLLNHEVLLKKVHFVDVEDILSTPRGMIFYSDHEPETSFLYCKNGQQFTNPEQAFHDLRLQGQGDCYIGLAWSQAYLTMVAFGVLEDNPYASKEVQVSSEVEKELSHLEVELNRKIMEEAINKALETGDKEAFYRLSDQLIAIEKLEQQARGI